MSELTKEQYEEAEKLGNKFAWDIEGCFEFSRRELARLIAYVRSEALERSASQCEKARPAGGRAWDEAQAACFDALTHVAQHIRTIKEPK